MWLSPEMSLCCIRLLLLLDWPPVNGVVWRRASLPRDHKITGGGVRFQPALCQKARLRRMPALSSRSRRLDIDPGIGQLLEAADVEDRAVAEIFQRLAAQGG